MMAVQDVIQQVTRHMLKAPDDLYSCVDFVIAAFISSEREGRRKKGDLSCVCNLICDILHVDSYQLSHKKVIWTKLSVGCLETDCFTVPCV